MVEDPTFNLDVIDVIWKSSLILCASRPAWSGMMQIVNAEQHPGRSSVMFLPMIDLEPSNPSCVFSTPQLVSFHAASYNVTQS